MNPFQRLARAGLRVALVVGALIMAGLVAAGLIEIARAVSLLFSGIGRLGSAGHGSESVELRMALRGIELLFLSPMALLIVYGIRNYVTDVRNRSRVGGTAAPDDVETVSRAGAPAVRSGTTGSSAGHGLFLELKGGIISLLAALLATDATARILSEEEFDYGRMGASAGLILILAVYFFVLERLASRHRASESP